MGECTSYTAMYIAMWIDGDGKGGWKVPSGKGQRLILVHAGGWKDGHRRRNRGAGGAIAPPQRY